MCQAFTNTDQLVGLIAVLTLVAVVGLAVADFCVSFRSRREMRTIMRTAAHPRRHP